MKKKLQVLSLLLLFAATMHAADYVVAGAGSAEVNGTYTESGTYNGMPQYRLGSTFYFLRYNDMGPSRWEIWDDDMWMTYYYTNISGSTPPSTGWVRDMFGMDPAPSVALSGATLLFSPDYFGENSSNNGSISNSITITCDNYNGEIFTGSNGENFITAGKAVVTNLPAGLTAALIRTGDLTLAFSLVGNATDHSFSNSIGNLTLQFQNSAFGSGIASNVNGSLKSDLKIYYLAVEEQNLVLNPGAENDYSAWTKTDGGDGWIVGNDAPSAHSGSKYWVSSYRDCTLIHTLSLEGAGYAPGVLDGAPAISAGVYVLPGYLSGGNRGTITILIELLDGSNGVLSSRYISNNQALGDTTTWIHKSASISGYGAGLRKIRMTLVGKDAPTWGGHYGPSFDDAYIQMAGPLPVELSSFTANISGSSISLHWHTATEVNNYGFEIERRAVKSEQRIVNGEQETANREEEMVHSWKKIGFVNGAGTSNAPKEYSYSDATASSGSYIYRLKQIDQNGTFKYSDAVEVSFLKPEEFSLGQNYPNPFNPSTTIAFTLAEDGYVSLKVFDILGREVVRLVNAQLKAGVVHRAIFDASRFSSGMYFYRLETGQSVQVKKMMLMK